MKTQLLIASLLAGSLLARAQDSTSAKAPDEVLKNKKGHEILPKKGDIGLGFNTIPILDMFLGSINRSTPFAGSGNIVQYAQASNNQLVGKYFLDAKTAIRVRFGVNTLGGSVTNKVQDATAMYQASMGTQDDRDAAALLRVDDRLTFNKSNWMIAAGLEKRRGYRRLQGFYGAEFGIGSTSASEKIGYGNNFSNLYPVQYTDNFNTLTTATQSPSSTARVARATERNYRGGMRIGLRGFIGIEYFIFAKISLAAEYGWAYSITTRRAAKTTQEVYFNGQNGATVVKETVDADSREVLRGFSVDNNNGSVFSLNNTLNGNTALSGGAGALTLHFYF